MTRNLLILCVFAILLGPVLGSTKDENTLLNARPLEPEEVIPPSQDFVIFDRIIYVLDLSGSMIGDQLDEAIAVTDTFATDGFLATVITFNHDFVRWNGVVEECSHPADVECGRRCLPRGWGRMPLHREEMREHIASVERGGGTEPGPALQEAIRIAPSSTLIVFVSDGEFATTPALQAVTEAMRWRREQRLDPVRIFVWSTTRDAEEVESLVEIARIGGGGLWRAVSDEPEPEPDQYDWRRNW